MTASERLRELERAGATGRWEVYEETHHEPTDDPKYTDRWILDDGVILNWGDGDIPLGPAELIVTLRNALPLIADVIEAAEEAYDDCPNMDAPYHTSVNCNFCSSAQVQSGRNRLTALRDALQPEGA